MASSTFIAKYPGTCAADCGQPIKPGDECIHVVTAGGFDDDDRPKVAHVECDASAIETSPNARAQWGGVCPHCHMATPLSGVCDCQD